MKLKMKARDILLACNMYESEREQHKRDIYTLVDADDIMWNQIRDNMKDEFFISAKKMAEYAEQSEYPYLIINQKEFNKMEKYL